LGNFTQFFGNIWEGEGIGGGGWHIPSFLSTAGSSLSRYECDFLFLSRAFFSVKFLYGESQYLSFIIVDISLSSSHSSYSLG
jgi:hypothetical protein